LFQEAINMSIQVQAIYENGILRPLQSVPLTENQEVTVTIEVSAAASVLLPSGDGATVLPTEEYLDQDFTRRLLDHMHRAKRMAIQEAE
jgi:predicted DNA-binding antitoxin AbrB/MazE fold protein